MKLILNLEEKYRQELAKDVLKKAGYKCQVCGIKKGTVVLKNENKTYIELDEFQQTFYKDKDVKTMKIYLRVLQISGEKNSLEFKDYKVLCPVHSQQVMKERIKEGRLKKKEWLNNLRLEEVKGVRNYIFQSTGKYMELKDALWLFLYIEELIVKKSK